jgi:hypothetical protein
VNDWARLLDRYEAVLTEHAAVLEGRATQAPAWAPPPVPAGGIPPELRDRAEELLRRTGELTRLVEEARDQLPTVSARRPSNRGATGPSWVDATL